MTAGASNHDVLRTLERKLWTVAHQSLGSTETVYVLLKGKHGQALLAADDRILILKAGWLVGATLGGKATSFPYEQVAGIELNLGPMNTVLQIQTSAFQAGRAGSVWTTDPKQNPAKLPNCITADTSRARGWQAQLDAIRRRVAQGHWGDEPGTESTEPPQSPAHDTPSDLVAQLAKLAELERAGALTAAEFEQAKKRLLSDP